MKALLTFITLACISVCHSQRKPLPVADEKQQADTTFVNIRDLSDDFIFDMRYATENNFLKSKVYDCGECYLRYKTAIALIEANKAAAAKNYKIVIFDCYRPLEIQKRMWKIVSNPKYVADPSKGSIHNRGGAVDISLADLSGKSLDMGSEFDHFGKEAAHSYTNLSELQISNRKLLAEIMTSNGFSIFESEWWHYNLNGSGTFPLSDFKWNCY